jgi:hypothetical protein
MRAYVHAYTTRGKLRGYSVFTEWLHGSGQMHGKCIGTFDLKDYSAEVALHLANTLRDDFNQEYGRSATILND